MPSSTFLQINEILELIVETNPARLLDIGTGFGKFGFLSREYLELWDTDQAYGEWKRQIDGIEAFEAYITPLQKEIYDHIFIGNALELLPGMKDTYDLVLLVDVLEHFTYQDGLRVLKECRRISKNILIAVPESMTPQDAVFGNSFEVHQYPWSKKDFSLYADKFFLNTARSLIIYIGDDNQRILGNVKKRYHWQLLKDNLDLIGMRRPLRRLFRLFSGTHHKH